MGIARTRMVLSSAAAATALAAILLPFTLSTSPADVLRAWVARGSSESLGEMWPIALPFLLAVPIAVFSFAEQRVGHLAHVVVGVAWLAAFAGVGAPLSFLGAALVREPPSQSSDWVALAVFMASLAVGTVVMSRRSARQVNHGCLAAMQFAYVTNALFCLVTFSPVSAWQSGAWWTAATVVLYALQMLSERAWLPKRAALSAA